MNKINSINNSTIRNNSNRNKQQNLTYYCYSDNHYGLNNNQFSNVYGNRDNNKIIINTVYNSYTNNIYPIPRKTSYSNYKKNKLLIELLII